jgi:hypothetical protein
MGAGGNITMGALVGDCHAVVNVWIAGVAVTAIC